MPEVFLEFLGDASPWLLVLLIPLYFWGKLNYSALNNHESHPESYQRAVNWLREDNVGQLYVQFLGWLMDGVSRLIGDRHKFGQAYATSAQPRGIIHKTFGFNPFTPESYERLLRLAFMYPVLAFLLVWAIGGTSGDWLGLPKVSELISGWRWLFILGFGTALFVAVWFVFRGIRWIDFIAFLMVAVVLLVIKVLTDSDDLSEGVTGMIELGAILWFAFWGVFVYFFSQLYLGGWASAWLIFRSAREAHQYIYKNSIAVAVFFAFVAVFIVYGMFVADGLGDMMTFIPITMAMAVIGVIAGVFAVAGFLVFLSIFLFNLYEAFPLLSLFLVSFFLA